MCPLSQESAKSSVVWIARPIKRRALTRQALSFDARFAVGRQARTTAGLVLAATPGTRSTQGECAPPACTVGLQHSVCRVLVGLHIPTGMRSHETFEAEI